MLPAPSGLGPLGVAALIIAALYVGREVFVPVASPFSSASFSRPPSVFFSGRVFLAPSQS